MLSPDQTIHASTAPPEGAFALPNAVGRVEVDTARLLNPETVTAAAYWPLYMQMKAEAEAICQEMERRIETQPNFDSARYEREFIAPAWARRSAFASFLLNAPVSSDRDMIAKAFLVAENMADGIMDKEQGARLMMDCMAFLKSG